MKALVVYDSIHGNTEAIARAIAQALAQALGDALPGEISVLRAGQVDPAELTELDLLIVGAPTHGGRPTEAIRDFLDRVPAPTIAGVRVATFDTRIPTKWVRIFGYAAGRIAGTLKRTGANLIVEPEGFFVKGTEGPLVEGEAERAAEWARQLAMGIDGSAAE